MLEFPNYLKNSKDLIFFVFSSHFSPFVAFQNAQPNATHENDETL